MGRSASRALGNLPAEVTSLVGRQVETGEVRALLARSRLVTLTGPGGVGKTRLALHAARSARAAFPDGVWMTHLAELTEPELLATTVMSAVDRPGAAGTRNSELRDFIADRQMLLILDNCEHLAEAVAALAADLLQGCHRLTMLVTGREALRIAGEALYKVPPLPVPRPGTSMGAALRYDAVALFHERVGVLNRGFSVSEADQEAVVELCQRLDGLPLAIELTASSTRWLSIPTLLQRAEDPLALRGGHRGVPERHQSVRASLDYSHELCSQSARRLWARLSVFRGGAELESIDAVCVGGALDRRAVATALFELVDKSIVLLDGSRYRMLETIRQYGEELLESSGDTASTRAAHLDYFASTAANVEADWFGPDQAALLRRVLADEANVRAALQSSLTQPGQVRTGLRMATALWTYWIGCGRPGEGRHWLGQLLDAADDPVPERVPALWVNGFLTVVDGDIPRARRILDECLRAAAAVHDEGSAAHALSTLGLADLFEGRTAEAIEHLEEGVELERRLDDASPYLADMLINLGLAYCYHAEPAKAVGVLEEARALCIAKGEELLLSWAVLFIGLVELLEGRAEDAAALARDALVLKRALHAEQGVVWAVELLAWAELEMGNPRRAALLLGACESRAHDFGPIFHGFKGMLESHEEYVRRTRQVLGPHHFETAVARGALLTMPELVAVALNEDSHPVRAPGTPRDLPLTPREREIAQLVARGKTNREIAAELVIAPRTVDTHVQHILTKLDFTSRSQVAALMAVLGTASPESARQGSPPGTS